jgi:hypothetical protein
VAVVVSIPVATPFTSATTLYFANACVPTVVGAVSTMEALVEPAVTVTVSILGALGKVIEVETFEEIAGVDWLDGLEVPTELVAVTTNVYGLLPEGTGAPAGFENVSGLLLPLTVNAVATPPMYKVAV